MLFSQVKELIKSMLGETNVTSSDVLIDMAIKRAQERIIAEINYEDIPEGLKFVWADMALGDILFTLKSVNGLGENFDFSQAYKSITEGDISVTLGDGANQETMFNAYIEKLLNPDSVVFASYRRLKW